jgi:hypothetical protein
VDHRRYGISTRHRAASLRRAALLSDNWISPPTTITSPHFEA